MMFVGTPYKSIVPSPFVRFAGRRKGDIEGLNKHLADLAAQVKEGQPPTPINCSEIGQPFGIINSSVARLIKTCYSGKLRTMTMQEVNRAKSSGDFQGLEKHLADLAAQVKEGDPPTPINCTEIGQPFGIRNNSVARLIKTCYSGKLRTMTQQETMQAKSSGDFQGLEKHLAELAAQVKEGDPPTPINCTEIGQPFGIKGSSVGGLIKTRYSGKLRPMTNQEVQRRNSSGDFQGLEKHLAELAAQVKEGDPPTPINCTKICQQFGIKQFTVGRLIKTCYSGKLRTMTLQEAHQAKIKDTSEIVAIPQFRTSSGHLSSEGILNFQWHVEIGGVPYSEEQLRQLVEEKNTTSITIDTLREALRIIEQGKHQAQQLTPLQEALIRSGQLPIDMDITGPLASVEFRNFEQAASKSTQAYLDVLTGKSEIPQLSQPNGWTTKPARQLKAFQRKGLSWMAYLTSLQLGACLSDDMGLGKTAQALALILHKKNTTPAEQRKPTLVVVPKSLLSGWQAACREFTPTLVLQNVEKITPKVLANLPTADIVLTTYDTLLNDAKKPEEAKLSKPQWAGVILDEGQRIKNTSTRITQLMAAIASNAQYRVVLTGTPLENHVGELYSLMNFLNPGYLGTPQDFQTHFFNPIHQAPVKISEQGDVEEDPAAAEAQSRLARLITPFTLRRVKTDPAILQEIYGDKKHYSVNRTTQPIVLSTEEQASYQTFCDELKSRLEDPALKSTDKQSIILGAITQLKQLCNHPSFAPQNPQDENSLSAKQHRLNELVRNIVTQKQEKTLVFTQYRKLGDILYKQLNQDYPGRVIFFHGGLSNDEREEAIAALNLRQLRQKMSEKPDDLTATEKKVLAQYQDKPEPAIMILTTKSGNAGLNLQAANHVIHYDQWWNPAVMSQAEARVDRIGQEKDVSIHYLVTKGTIEERIQNILTDKAALFARILEPKDSILSVLKLEDLVRLVLN